MNESFNPNRSAILPCNTGNRADPINPIVSRPEAIAVFFPIPSIEIEYNVGKKIDMKNPSRVMAITGMNPVVVIIKIISSIAAIRQNTRVTAGQIFL